MSVDQSNPADQAAPRKLGSVKMYCRCGQKVRISLPAPKPEGRCPKCGHVFVLPQVPLEYQRPAADPVTSGTRTAP